jgi:poly-beta-hydroxybutyrate-responsive repressor
MNEPDLAAPPDAAGEHDGAAGEDAGEGSIHRGWAPSGARRRWLEPFVLVLLATEPAHGYAITGALEAMGVASGPVDLGQVYRTLRDLEAAGEVTSAWSADPVGPQRRQYQLTEAGFVALAEWAAVMTDRARLIDEFEAMYVAALAGRAGAGIEQGRG